MCVEIFQRLFRIYRRHNRECGFFHVSVVVIYPTVFHRPFVAARGHYLPFEFHGDSVIFLPSFIRHHLAIDGDQRPALLLKPVGVAKVDDMAVDAGHENDVVWVGGFHHPHEFRGRFR